MMTRPSCLVKQGLSSVVGEFKQNEQYHDGDDVNRISPHQAGTTHKITSIPRLPKKKQLHKFFMPFLTQTLY